MDLAKLKTLKVDNPKYVHLKLSETARNLLKAASRQTGQDMSTLVDMLITTHLQGE